MKNKKVKLALLGTVAFATLSSSAICSSSLLNSKTSITNKTALTAEVGDTFEAECRDLGGAYLICTVVAKDATTGQCSIKIKLKNGNPGTYNIPTTITSGGTNYTVTEIDDESFLNKDGQTISIPNGIKKVGKRAFEGCTRLGGKLVIPSSCTTISENAFKSTSFTQIDLPAVDYTIGKHAFASNVNTALHVHIKTGDIEQLKKMIKYDGGKTNPCANYAFASDDNNTPNTKVRVYFDDPSVTDETIAQWRNESVELWDGTKIVALKLWEALGLASEIQFGVKPVTAINFKDVTLDDIQSTVGKRITTPNLSDKVWGDNGLQVLDSLHFELTDASQLPTGLSFDTNTGVITGIVKAKTDGKILFSVKGIYNTSTGQLETETKEFNITIDAGAPLVISDSELTGIAGDELEITATLNGIDVDTPITWTCSARGYIEFESTSSLSGNSLKFKLLKKTHSSEGIKIIAKCLGEEAVCSIKIDSLPEIDKKTLNIEIAIAVNAFILVFAGVGLYYLFRNIQTKKKIKACTVSSDVITRYKKLENKKEAKANKKGLTYQKTDPQPLIEEFSKEKPNIKIKEEGIEPVASADISDESYNVYTSLLSKTKTVKPDDSSTTHKTATKNIDKKEPTKSVNK